MTTDAAGEENAVCEVIQWASSSAGVPGFIGSGSVCDPLHVEGDVQPAAVTPDVSPVCDGGRGGAK